MREARVLTLPAEVSEIKSKAFAYLSSADIIVIPVSVTSIAPDAFIGSEITLSVAAGSYAESWAVENDIPYIVR